MHRPYIDEITLVDENGIEYNRIAEVIDCWFESGSMPFAQDHYPFQRPEWKQENFPAGFVAEYIAQTRTWFYYTHAVSTVLFGEAPFKHVVTTGTLLAEDGQKMSKSKGNYPDPWILFNKYGVDPLRLYLMSSPLMKGEDANFSEKLVQEISSKIIGRLGNVLTFYELYRDIKVEAETLVASANVLDQWITSRLNQLIAEVTSGMNGYDMTLATRPFDLFIDDLSTWYLRRSRERIKEGEAAAKQTLYTVLKTLAVVMAPFTPFMAEDVWQRVKHDTDVMSVHLAPWPEAGEVVPVLLEKMSETRAVVSLGLEARQKAGVPVRQPLTVVKSKVDLSSEYQDLVIDELNVKGFIHEAALVSAIELDFELTDDLRLEGKYRELVRAVQDLRKKQGLTPSDVIGLSLSENAKVIVAPFEIDMKNTVLAQNISFDISEGELIEIDGMKIYAVIVK